MMWYLYIKQTIFCTRKGAQAHCCFGFNIHTVFTWLNTVATITVVAKIDAATIQIQPLLIAQK